MEQGPINSFLERIKVEGRSSPAGQHWAAFHALLSGCSQPTPAGKPPPPLILAAAGESGDSKHRRLGEQLRWAEANGVLTDALQFLNDLKPDQWNSGSAESWNRSLY
jgi:hypothetical protein